MIVTHNMQQASRVSDRTAFFTMGEERAGYLVEADDTVKIFTNPREQLTEDYISGPVRLMEGRWRSGAGTLRVDQARSRAGLDRDERTVKDGILRMGSLVESQIRDAIRSVVERDTDLAQR